MTKFAQALAYAQRGALRSMGEEILIDNIPVQGIVQPASSQEGRVALGGVTDIVNTFIVIDEDEWRTHAFKQGARVKFRGLEARVTETVNARGNRLQLNLEPVNRRNAIPGF